MMAQLGRTIMDQNSIDNLQVVHGDFPIKFGPKTLKHPWSIYLKTLGHFKITILKYNGNSIFFPFFFNYWSKRSEKNLVM